MSLTRRLAPIAAVCIATALPLAAPSTAMINGQSGGYLFRGTVTGLVTVAQKGDGVTVAFNLFGLRPQTKYRLVASSKRCGTAGGEMFARGFTSDGRGTAWDPVTISANAAAIRSLSVRERATGTTVACSGKAAIPVGPGNLSIKVDRPKAVVMVSEATAQWQILQSVSGLSANTGYRAVALPGGCVKGATPLFGKRFRSTAQGNAVVRAQREAVAGSSIGSVAVVQRATGRIVFCESV